MDVPQPPKTAMSKTTVKHIVYSWVSRFKVMIRTYLLNTGLTGLIVDNTAGIVAASWGNGVDQFVEVLNRISTEALNAPERLNPTDEKNVKALILRMKMLRDSMGSGMVYADQNMVSSKLARYLSSSEGLIRERLELARTEMSTMIQNLQDLLNPINQRQFFWVDSPTIAINPNVLCMVSSVIGRCVRKPLETAVVQPSE